MSEDDTNEIIDKTATCGTLQLDEVPVGDQTLDTLGPYKIGREIGRGAMGTVYEAVHDQLQRTVALKILPPELAESPKRLQRFRHEMAAIGRLEHPNIVLATDAGDADGLSYIAMQFIDGPDLEAILNEIGRLDPTDACEIVRQTALGLQHIHQQRLVHRDIKPSNIVLTRRGEVKILDFGIAMLRNVGDRDTAMTAVGQLMGTPDYIAPEQIGTCYDVDIRADTYSLGCTLYRLLSGTAPFAGPGYTTFTAKLLGHAERDPAPLAELCPEIPAEIVQLVERMMAKNRGDRPASPQDVVDAIAEFCKDADLTPIASGQRRLKGPVATRTANVRPKRTGTDFRLPKAAMLASGVVAATVIGTVCYWAVPMVPRNDTASMKTEPAACPVSLGDAALESVRPEATADRSPSMELAVNEIAVSNQSIATNTAQIAKSIDELREHFQQSLKNDATVEDPQSPADHYFNARIYSLRGDHAKARKSFLAYFADDLSVVDPHLQFVQYLKLQEGLAGARELYRELPGDSETPARRLAFAMLQQGEQRTQMLQSLIAEQPEFAPAWYELSRQYSAVQKPTRTLTAMQRERELLEEFVRLNENGKLLKHYLDHSKIPPMLADAQQRLKLIQNYVSVYGFDSLGTPVKFKQAAKDGNIWRVELLVAEPSIEIQYRVGPEGDFNSTGINTAFTDPNTGKPIPRMNFELSGDTPACSIQVQYVDADEKLQGPYSLPFDPDRLQAQHERSMLEMTKPAWLIFNGDKLMFTLFQEYRSQIRSVVYGIDQETPTLSMPVPSRTTGDLSWDEFAIAVPASAKFATIQVTYIDGTKSEIVKLFRRK